MTVLLIIAVIVIACSVYCIGNVYTTNYNKDLPAEYINDTYPKAEILEHTSEGDAVFNAHIEKYLCFDNDKKFAFEQEFYYHGIFSRLYPVYDNGRSYENMTRLRQSYDNCINSISAYYQRDYYANYSPDNISGIVVFVRLKDAEDIDILVENICNSVSNEKNINNTYIPFVVYVCNDNIYDCVVHFNYDSLFGQQQYIDVVDNNSSLSLLSEITSYSFVKNEVLEYGSCDIDTEVNCDIIVLSGDSNILKDDITVLFASEEKKGE